jgi:hypothetical protein
MKRLAWLLLAVFCTALVQIQPAQGMPAKAKACACCPVPAGCGTTDCCPPAAFAAVTLGAEASEQASPAASRSERTVRGAAALFYASFVEPAALRPVLPASAQAAAAASVPLFKAHCCFLI